jgi:glucose-1-phosphate thymidylyltransferase
MKGIVLAGGSGTRLWPMTKIVSKQLLPVYDKPMIYYPISTLMLAGVREILIITTPNDEAAFKSLLGDGSQFGIKFEYAIQASPDGLAQAFIIGEDFLGSDSCLMILGDNIFHGAGLGQQLQKCLPATGGHIFTYEIEDPTQYGVLTLSSNGAPVSIEEKPTSPTSNLAVTGLYFFDNRVSEIAKKVLPSSRGELEITSIIDWYLQRQELSFTKLTRGIAWLDTGNPNALHDAATYVKIIEARTGLKIACLEEIAFYLGLISADELKSKAQKHSVGAYHLYLQKISREIS